MLEDWCPGKGPLKTQNMTSLSPVHYHCSFSLFVLQLVVGEFNGSGFCCCSIGGHVADIYIIINFQKKFANVQSTFTFCIYFAVGQSLILNMGLVYMLVQ